MSMMLVIQLAIIALFLGSIPFAINAYKGSSLGLYRLSSITIFITFDLILFGAFTRLTDSGLGCPDWPGCYGHSNPLLASEQISLAQSQMPFGPVTQSKAWIEMLHRYFASGVGFLILSIAIITWINRQKLGQFVTSLSIGLFFLVCLQGAFGAFTVTLKLQPLIVTTHLLLALLLLGALVVLNHMTNPHQAQEKKDPHYSALYALGLMLVCCLQIFLGAWVSTNYAVLACQDFPTCNGSLVPAMDFQNGFTFWRELGKTVSGEYLPIEALIAIHWLHRVFAGIVFISITFFYFHYRKLSQSGTSDWHLALNKWLKVLASVAVLQFATGLSNVVLQWPLIAALIHTGGAALLIVATTKLLLLALPKPTIINE
ncbi:COX15/CtaA family protein [Polynucleobacter kasalickyi]|uniref:Cytochrome c oxidase assembly protein subunit 15 n=1 Tax=Polynucleobacter kasalickyi TaxID=1938817 RepID=A0A1W2ARD4_9BURK|nr:COX15/CtaA family protein [Polynucleobacter kasalickyi]SMC63144.1 cytochrome c oxidase assembly protein subunit 15 [Polynucleobacter kasalickyi]